MAFLLSSKVKQYRWLRWVTIWLMIAGLAFLALGCSGRTTPVSRSGTIDPNAPAGAVRTMATLQGEPREVEGWKVEISYVRGKMVVKQETVVKDGGISIESPRLFVGDWQIVLHVFGPSGNALYTGRAEVTVQEDTTTPLRITLGPADGKLVVTLDLSEFSNIGGLIKGRLMTNEDAYVNFDIPEPRKPVEVSMDLPPRQYDIAVAIYKDTYHAYQRVYLSPYQTLEINSGTTTRVAWRPQVGLVDIDLDIREQPKPPSNVTLSYQGGWAVLSWDPSPTTPLTGYRIYTRTDEQFLGYQLWQEVDAFTKQWSFSLGEFAGADRVSFVITAVDPLGHESTRSNSVLLTLDQ